MWQTLEGWQSRAGPGNSPRTLLEELGRIQVVDVVLPIADGPELRLRCVAQLDGTQAALPERMGLSLSKRLRHPGVPEMQWERRGTNRYCRGRQARSRLQTFQVGLRRSC
jgi:hypothetical protein